MKTNLPKHVLPTIKHATFALVIQCLTLGYLWAGNGIPKAVAEANVGSLGYERGEAKVSVINRMEISVSGTVTDQNGAPLPGVTVSVPGSTIGTATDLEGRYVLLVPEGSNLVFSFIGFESQTITVGQRTVIDVVLIEDMASLDEVVVVGYGVQQKVNLTGAISTV